MMFSNRVYADFVDHLRRQVEELWKLVWSLQKERDYWKDKCLQLLNVGDQTYVPEPPPPSESDTTPPEPLGQHFSIFSLRNREMLKSRARARELQEQVDKAKNA